MVALVLHSGVERHHRKIVGVCNGVNITRKSKRKSGKRDYLRKASASRTALDVESGTSRRLAHTADHLLAKTPKPLHKAKRCGGLALAQGGRRNGRHVNIFALATSTNAL